MDSLHCYLCPPTFVIPSIFPYPVHLRGFKLGHHLDQLRELEHDFELPQKQIDVLFNIGMHFTVKKVDCEVEGCGTARRVLENGKWLLWCAIHCDAGGQPIQTGDRHSLSICTRSGCSKVFDVRANESQNGVILIMKNDRLQDP